MTRRGWIIYACCTALLLAGLGWISAQVLGLEASRRTMEAEQARLGDLRLALWRMDSWLVPRLAREAARPYFEYQPYVATDRVYDEMLQPVDTTSPLLRPSPLLTPVSAEFPLHFQMGDDGVLSSPQVPHGLELELAFTTCSSPGVVDIQRGILARLSAGVDFSTLERAVGCSEALGEGLANNEDVQLIAPVVNDGERAQKAESVQTLLAADEPASGDYQGRNVFDNRVELQKRAQNTKFAREASNWMVNDALVPVPPEFDELAVSVGELVPVWTDEPVVAGVFAAAHTEPESASPSSSDGRDLLFVRRVDVNGGTLLQGFVADWTRVQAALLAEVSDLVEGASLQPLDAEATTNEDDAGLLLATIPTRLVAPAALVPPAVLGPVHLGLGLTWLAALVAVLAVGGTLRASFSLAERRSRFASAVTHELRTPLTTFRMYSQMLADDMVPEPERRAEYLRTLEEESARLAQLVENVLSYARLEEGRAHANVERLTVGDLLARLEGSLERRAGDAGLGWVCDPGDAADVALSTDVTVVGQVLFNLVDNAAKYAADGDPARIELAARRVGGQLQLRVRDHGPGIPTDAVRAIFDAFERRGPETTPGVGLGLALARGLARELGGELRLGRTDGPGACFVLELPA